MAGHKRSGRKAGKDAGKSAEESAPERSFLLGGSLQVARPVAIRLLGISDRTFLRLESEGIFRAVTAGSGRRHSVYDAPAIIAAYMARERRQLTGSNLSPRDRRDRSQAELNELRLARERGEVLPREDVVKKGQAYIKATMAKLRAIPSRLIRAGAITPTVEPVVAELIREAQEEMARWQNELDLERAVTEKAP